MTNPMSISFDHILTTMVRNARVNLKTGLCVFLQLDDSKRLRVRAVDGKDHAKWRNETFSADNGGILNQCLKENRIVRIDKITGKDDLKKLLKPAAKALYAVVP